MCNALVDGEHEHARIERPQQRRAEKIGVLDGNQKLESVVSVPLHAMRTYTYDVIS